MGGLINLFKFCFMRKLFFLLFAVVFSFVTRAQVSLTATSGTTSGTFTTLKGAFDAINAGTHQGDIVISINASTSETTTSVLNSSGAGSASYTSILIRPTSDGVTISGASATGRGLIELNGADNVSIDGDNPNTSGTNRNLTISNTAANTVTYNMVIRLAAYSSVITSSNNNTIKNCIINGSATGLNVSTTTSTSSSANLTYGIYVGSTGTSAPATATTSPSAIASTSTTAPSGATFTNTTIQNNLINSCARGIMVQGGAATVATNLLITENIIGAATAASSSTVYSYGIGASGGSGTISKNIVRNLESFLSATIRGISVDDATSVSGDSYTIELNTVGPIINRSTGTYGIYGINASSGSGHVFRNNIVFGLNGDMTGGFAFSTSFGIFGIRIGGGTNHKVYHNSVNISAARIGTANSSLLSAAFAITTTSATGANVCNNIFSNTMTGGTTSVAYVAMYLPSAASSTLNLTLNNNALYTGTTSGIHGIAHAGTTYTNPVSSSGIGLYTAGNFSVSSTASVTNLRNYTSGLSSAGTNDNATLVSTSSAPFVSSTDLHLNLGTTPTQLESGGVDVSVTGVTTDLDNQVRPGPTGSTNGGASAPDIGADEFDGVPLDLTGPTISYTALSNICTPSIRTLTATITDASGIPTSGNGLPVLYWRINSGVYTSAVGTSIGGNQYTFQFGAGAVNGDVVYYYIVAQDLAPTPNVSVSPSIGASTLTTNPPAAGTSPSSPSSYTVLNVLAPGTYTVSSSIPGANYTSLTAAIAAYNNSCLSGPVIFELLDASYTTPNETFPIIINSNITASATNTLTIRPSSGVSPEISGSSTSAIIRLNGADFITIDGSNTVGGTSRNLTISNSNSGTSSVVLMLSSASAADGANNNTIRNISTLGQASSTTFVGIYSGSGSSVGSSSEAAHNNNQYINNSVARSSYGIAIVGASGGQTGNTLSNNTIGSTTVANYIGYIGVFLSNLNGAQFTSNTIQNIITTSTNPVGLNIAGNVVNSSFNANTIKSIHYTGTGGYGGKGINIYTGTASSNLTISNNMISDIRGDGWSSLLGDAVVGIRIGATNSSNSTTGGIKLYNNSVNLGSGSFAGNASGTQSAALFLSSVTSDLDIRNNVFATNLLNSAASSAKSWAIYSAAANTAFTNIDYNNYSVSGSQGVLSYLGSDRTSLSALQSAFGGNSNSRNSQPNFVSATDLHLPSSAGQNWSFESAGTPISSVSADIDGDTRDASKPDIGADEFNATGFTVTNPTPVCLPATVDLTASTITGGTISGATFTYFTDQVGTTTLVNPSSVATSGTYYIKASYGSADNYWFKPVTVTINPQPTPSISGSNSICANSTGNVYSVTNVTGNTYAWTVTGGTVTAGAGTNSITVTWGAAGTGTVAVLETITATSCTQTNSLSVTINPNPTPSITGSTAVCTTNTGYVYSVTSVAGNTYSWTVTGGTITAGAGTNSITVTWGAAGTGTVAVTQTTTATGCATTVSSSINIQILPTATSAVVEPVTCASENGQINLTLGGAAGPYTYAWTGTGNGLTATTQNQAAVSTGFYNVTVTAANGCTTSLTNIVVAGPGGCFICPTIGSIAATNTIICQNTNNTISVSGLADLGITYGIQFKYSMTPLANPYLSTAGTVMNTVTNANLTGSGTGASTTYSFPTAGTVYVYAILSPTSPDPACRPYLVKSFAVAATPALTDPTDQVLCTGSTTSAVSLVATPSATTSFAWTNSRTSIGLAASGTGNIPAFTATNYTNAPVTATVVVTPTNTESAGGTTVACVGPTQSFTYTVNPIPTVNTVADQNVCAGTAVTLPFSGFVAGTVFEWTNSNTAIGLAASGTGNLSYTATNTTSSPITRR